MARNEEIYPMTLVCDRYGGTYSGGRYTAWACDPWDVPEEISEDDISCSIFWDDYNGLVGKGATPLQAMEDLRIKLNEDLEKNIVMKNIKVGKGILYQVQHEKPFIFREIEKAFRNVEKAFKIKRKEN